MPRSKDLRSFRSLPFLTNSVSRSKISFLLKKEQLSRSPKERLGATQGPQTLRRRGFPLENPIGLLVDEKPLGGEEANLLE